MTDFIPSSASRRRVIAVLDQHEIDDLSLKGDVQLLNDPQAHVLAYPLTDSNDPVLNNILDAGLDRPNTILVQSPFDPEKYVDAAEAIDQFALEKHTLLSNFCQLLGAKKISVTQMERVTNGKVQEFSAEAGKLIASGNVQGERTQTDSVSSQINLIDEYPGSEANIEEAELLLRSNRLLGDLNMKSLLQARRASGNPIKRRTLTVNLTTEASKNLKVAGNLNLPESNFSAEYKSSIKQDKEYKLTIEVLF